MDPRISTAVTRMHDDVGQPLSVTTLAAGAGLSASRFIHLFTAEIGVSPARYLRGLRFARARAEIETTSLPVRHVMTRAGFGNASHFSRAFKLRFGVSPRAMRRRGREAAPSESAPADDPGAALIS